MAAQLYQFVQSKEVSAFNPPDAALTPDDLHDLPLHYLEPALERLSAADKVDLLQNKIFPVAYFPNITLYGAAGEQARINAVASGKKVIARVEPSTLAIAIKRKLGGELLDTAIHTLRNKKSGQSAFKRMSLAQIFWISVLIGLVGLIYSKLSSEIFYSAVSFISGLFFLLIISLRVLCLFENKPLPVVKPKDFSNDDLPVYTVLVPVFRETRILSQLIGALSRLNYPQSKLDVKIILEETDIAMQRAIAALHLPEHFDVIVVPAGSPQTKPRALNYALQFARGSLLTIFDAEDVPEPMQLQKAVQCFATKPEKIACLQAELAFYNPNENWLTRQFTVEYATLFKLMLPAFVIEKLPLPLGGTSNHFRVSVLRRVGGWDPYNVTEDADLGLRLARHGYATEMLDSITYEEATFRFDNWLHQRSRWLKGFMQTWCVHMRNPATLRRELGTYGFCAMQATTLGLIVSALFHPFLIVHAIYTLCLGQFSASTSTPLLQALVGLNIVVLFIGYSTAIYAGYKALRAKHIAGWWLVLATMPLYWFLMSIAGWMALRQFIFNPHYWNKTSHGLSRFQK